MTDAFDIETARLAGQRDTPDTRTETSGDRALVSAAAERARHRAIVDSASDYAIIVTDLSGAITDWSAGATSVFGWTSAEMIGKPLAMIFTKEDRAAGTPEREMRAALAQDSGKDERWHERRGGTRFWASGEISPLRDDTGQHHGYVKVLRDRTTEHTATQALDLAEARYRALFDSIDEGFCIIEFFDGPHGPLSDYRHVQANSGYERHTGIANVLGKTLREIDPVDADQWLALYGGVLRTGTPIRFERYFKTAGRHIEVSAVRVEPESDKQVSVLFRDITARKQSEAALRASEAIARENIERVQLALSAGAIIGTWLWDLPNDRFTVDQAFAEACGLDPALGRSGLRRAQIVASVHPDDQTGLADAINSAIRRGGPYAHQYRVRRRDGKYHWIEANGRVDHGPDGTPLSFPGVLLDVGQRRAVEEERDRASASLRALNETLEQRVAERTAELMRAEEQLRQSQKMEAVGHLTGGLAHDFNNLLAGISGSLQMLSIRLSQGRLADVDKYVVAAQGAVRRAAALTHRLLAFSRRQTLDPRPTDVNALVNGMTDLIQRTVGPGIIVEAVGATALWPALVDAGQLENALLNLCINARDAMPEGGRITVETANKWLDRNAAQTHDMPEGQYLSLCVTDTGTGMTPDVMAKAFDPFFTTKPIGQGTGLGLSMIYGFAKQSGGQVRIYSEVGQGTTVCIYLPRFYGDVLDETVTPTTEPIETAEAGETVLIVDDEPSVRMLITDVLDDLGYTVIEAADSAAGLKILQSNVRIDLLVSDVGLPGGMNGRQMADAGRQSRPDLQVLFITGYAENSVIGNGHLEPGMQVMTKPFTVEALMARIREMVAAGTKS
ncbi:PAS domain S-box protein [Robbsia andropogonis]|uniref:PAS domain S-box protein n=1 Tax=Robbsia andropogonis TaxID=28092 RepID=UPI000466EA8F|nr:PAS domain S-box protein [Robbsia andropogonis]MCP1117790.1 PAS domain S-box protein [Robbsia andropogonis]MCP1127255.1 PAS domain S-box protein [Robbsia andropogonis]